MFRFALPWSVEEAILQRDRRLERRQLEAAKLETARLYLVEQRNPGIFEPSSTCAVCKKSLGNAGAVSGSSRQCTVVWGGRAL